MISGVINLFKDEGVSSQSAVTAVKKIFGGAKAGHTGTLDPMATGVLPVCVGRATKIADYLQAGDKTYEAVMRLGTETDTEDITGNVISVSEVRCCQEEIKSAADFFSGGYMQVPPMYSALSVNGKRLYKLAREGLAVERPARPAAIYGIKIISFDPPDVLISVDCAKGTYIRTLIADIGKRLGCGACMAKLIRTRSGIFRAEDSVTVNELKNSDDIYKFVIPADSALPLKKFIAAPEAGRALQNGGGVPAGMLAGAEELTGDEKIFIYDANKTLRGIYEPREGGKIYKLAVTLAGADGA